MRFWRGSIQSGFSLLSVMVAMGLSAVVLSMISSSFFELIKTVRDELIIAKTEQEVQGLRELMASELRMIGAGMPIDQANFQPGGAGLGDAPLAVLLNADNDFIEFRMNVTGETYTLATDFTPSVSSRSFDLVATTGLAVDETVYLSNIPSNRQDGLAGTIESISSLTLTLDSTFYSSSGATFPSGTTLTEIGRASFSSPADWSGIIRSSGTMINNLVPGSAFSIEYLDSALNSLALPLTDAIVAQELTALKLTTYCRSSSRLRNGQYYNAQAEQVIALRNLILARHS